MVKLSQHDYGTAHNNDYIQIDDNGSHVLPLSINVGLPQLYLRQEAVMIMVELPKINLILSSPKYEKSYIDVGFSDVSFLKTSKVHMDPRIIFAISSSLQFF